MKKIDLYLVRNCPHGRNMTQYCKHHETATRKVVAVADEKWSLTMGIDHENVIFCKSGLLREMIAHARWSYGDARLHV